jgi:hypothetical protein
MTRIFWLVDNTNAANVNLHFIGNPKLLSLLAAPAGKGAVVCYFGTASAAAELLDVFRNEPGFEDVIWFRFPLSLADRFSLLRILIHWHVGETPAKPLSSISEDQTTFGAVSSSAAAPPAGFLALLAALAQEFSRENLFRAACHLEQVVTADIKEYCGDLWLPLMQACRAALFSMEMENKALEAAMGLGPGSRFAQHYDLAHQFSSEGYLKIAGSQVAHCAQLAALKVFSRRIEFLKLLPPIVSAFKGEHHSGKYGGATAQLLLFHSFHMIGGARYSEASGQLSYSFAYLWKALELTLYSERLRAGKASISGHQINQTLAGAGKGLGAWFESVKSDWTKRYPAESRVIEDSISFRNTSRNGHALAVPRAAQLTDLRDSLLKVIEAEASRSGFAKEIALMKEALLCGHLCAGLSRGISALVIGNFQISSA